VPVLKLLVGAVYRAGLGGRSRGQGLVSLYALVYNAKVLDLKCWQRAKKVATI